MIVSKELITMLLDEFQGTTKLLTHDQIQEMNRIKLEIQSFNELIKKSQQDHNEKLKKLHANVDAFRERCHHEVFECYSSSVDSSGNYTECKICGYSQLGHYDINKRKKIHGV